MHSHTRTHIRTCVYIHTILRLLRAAFAIVCRFLSCEEPEFAGYSRQRCTFVLTDTGDAVIHLTRGSERKRAPAAAPPPPPAPKQAEASRTFSSTTPPTAKAVFEAIRKQEVVRHQSRENTARDVTTIGNIQRKLSFGRPGLRGGWSDVAGQELLAQLSKSKKKRPAKSNSYASDTPLSIEDAKPQPLAIMDGQQPSGPKTDGNSRKENPQTKDNGKDDGHVDVDTGKNQDSRENTDKNGKGNGDHDNTCGIKMGNKVAQNKTDSSTSLSGSSSSESEAER